MKSTDWVAQTIDIYFPIVLEARKAKIKVPANLGLSEGTPLGLQTFAF